MLTTPSSHNLRLLADLDGEDGGVVIEYGLVIATIVLLLFTAGDPVVNAITNFFGRMPASFPSP